MRQKAGFYLIIAKPRLLLYLLISFSVVYILFDYVKPNPDEYVSYLSYCIYFLGVIGLFLFFKTFIRIENEQRCANLVYFKAGSVLMQVKTGGLEYHLSEFKELGTKDEKLSVNRIVSHIHTEAESKKFDSGLTILNNYKEEFATMNMRLFGFQKVALQLGILGTFIGLAMAFKDLGGTKIDEHAIDHLLKSLKIPFSTSIAGLQVAFVLWLHLDYLHTKQERFFITMEKCIDEVISLARHALYKDSITVELQHVSSRMDELSGRIEKGNELLLTQNNYISKGLRRLKTANSDLDHFVNNISERQQEFLTSVKSLYDSLSPELISKELKHSLSNGAQEISGVMSKHLNDTLSRYSKVEDSMVTMNDHFKELQVYLENQAKQGEENITRHKQEIFESFSQMVAMQKMYLEQLSKVDMRSHIKELLSSASDNISKELRSDFERLIPKVSLLSEEVTFYNTYLKEKIYRRKRLWRWLTFSWGKGNGQIKKA